MSRYRMTMTDGGESWDLGSCDYDCDAVAAAETVLEEHGYSWLDVVVGDWDHGEVMIWQADVDAENDPVAQPLARIERS